MKNNFKRFAALLLSLALCLSLASCGKEEAQEADVTEPESTGEPVLAEATPVSPLIDEMPIETETNTITWVGLVSDSFGISLAYPSNWVNNPGKYTICYYDPDTYDTCLTRFTLTSKTLYHTPKASAMEDHLKEYLSTISEGYEKKSMEIGDLDKTQTFMGEKAYATTYLAYSGKTEVMGYVIMTHVENVLWVYHYSASYPVYNETQDTIMVGIRDSIHLTKEGETLDDIAGTAIEAAATPVPTPDPNEAQTDTEPTPQND